MTRSTIDYGIDLGTTNSEISCIEGTNTLIIKNNESQEFTPSAVYIDKKARIFVGIRAKARVMVDPDNAKTEFKRLMGTQNKLMFKNIAQELKPEQLSSEVLKSLKRDVQQRKGESLRAAVITVPASFELPACEATQEAARLAGIEFAPLLQEPIAAALAYGFQTEAKEGVFWMIYDLGGGTFDVSIVSIKAGRLYVVDHEGDNYLGGKDFDRALEDNVVTQLCQQYNLSGMNRSKVKYRSAYAKLKAHAEDVKIQLSQTQSAYFQVDELCNDTDGNAVDVDLEINRADFEKLITPLIERTIPFCKKVMERNNLSSSDVEKMILAGGQTLSPVVRQMLQDAIGIPLVFDIDPITIVAKGAAVFAGTQKLSVKRPPDKKGALTIELKYEPITQNTEPYIGGLINHTDSGKTVDSNYSIEIIRSDGFWRSGRIPLEEEGNFFTKLLLKERTQNEFTIEVFDSKGNKLEAYPDSFKITHGLKATEPPLSRSLGLALADNTTRIYLEKDTPLPAKYTGTQYTVIPVKKGQTTDILNIPVVEGEHNRADRNRNIGALVVHGDQIKRDLPINSIIEVTIDVDQSRILHTKAYIPLLDEEIKNVIKLDPPKPEPRELEKELNRQRHRIQDIRKKNRDVDDKDVNQALKKIEDEGIEKEIKEAIEAAKGGDPDAGERAQRRLLDFMAMVDKAEDLLEWPDLVRDAKSESKSTREIVTKYGNDADKGEFRLLEQEVNSALSSKDAELLKAKISALTGLRIRVLSDIPEFWIALFEDISSNPGKLSDQQAGRRLIEKGMTAKYSRDIETLKSVVRQLFDLMPREAAEEARMRAFGSGIK